MLYYIGLLFIYLRFVILFLVYIALILAIPAALFGVAWYSHEAIEWIDAYK